MAVHRASFSSQYNIIERFRVSRMMAEAIERQSYRAESKHFRELRESRRFEAKPPKENAYEQRF